MSAIPGINDRDFRIHGRTKRCPFLRMAHDNDICITTNDPYRIRNCLPFGNARLVRPCESNRLSTKTEHCRFKRKPRSGTWLVKKCCKLSAVCCMCISFWNCSNPVCEIQHFIRFFYCKIQRTYQMSHNHSPFVKY